jgi:pimeloyl-ACP methyl ester carboxylesterase
MAMSTFVLVPGACHGGWWWQPVVDRLTELGHTAVPVTLGGLGELDDLTRMRRIDLDVHISEASAALVAHRDEEGVVLVGHSYGGAVITGVADRFPWYVRALVYLDAFVPDDGDSCYAMTDDVQRTWYLADAERGPGVVPLPFFDPRAKPHPRASLLQRITLVDNWQQVPAKHYVVATGWPGPSPFADTAERIRRTPGWTVHDWPTTHNVLADGPDRVVELLTKA